MFLIDEDILRTDHILRENSERIENELRELKRDV
jgi:hypothetical protein